MQVLRRFLHHPHQHLLFIVLAVWMIPRVPINWGYITYLRSPHVSASLLACCFGDILVCLMICFNASRLQEQKFNKRWKSRSSKKDAQERICIIKSGWLNNSSLHMALDGCVYDSYKCHSTRLGLFSLGCRHNQSTDEIARQPHMRPSA